MHQPVNRFSLDYEITHSRGLVRNAMRSIILLILALFTVGIFPSSAQAQPACRENGGTVMCMPPAQGTLQFSAYDGAESIPGAGVQITSEGAMYSAILGFYLLPGNDCVASTSATPTPPWTYTLAYAGPGQPTSTVGFSTIVVNTTYPLTSPYCGPPSDGTHNWTVQKVVPLTCPLPWNSVVYGPPGGPANSPYSLGYCWLPIVQQCQNHQCTQQVGDPIDPAASNLTQREVDYSGSGGSILEFVRSYNHQGADFTAAPVNGSLGMGWTHTYERHLQIYTISTTTYVRAGRPDGSTRFFVTLPTGGFGEYGTAVDTLTATASGYTLVDENDNTEVYNSSGNLLSITYRGGRKVTMTYSTASTPSSIAPTAGLLISAADEFGHQLSFTWALNTNQIPMLVTMTDPSGAVYTYTNTSGLLTKVSFPDSTSRQYIYNESAYTQNANLPYALTGIIDELGNRYATFGFNSAGFAISSQHFGGVEQYQVLPYGGNAAVTDPLGVQRSYNYNQGQPVNGAVKFFGTNIYCAYCGDAPQSLSYDANGNVASKTDFNSNKTTFLYDMTRNLETSRTEASGSAVARTITTQWDPNWRQPDSVTEPNRTTAYKYDDLGNILTKTITDTTATPNVTRTWTYTYDSYGRVLTVDGPRTDVSDVTTYTYYTCTTGTQCGQLETIKNAVGQITTFNTYNARGQPLTITDPNGTVTTLTYDSRARVLSRLVATEKTAYSYYPTGLLETVTLPDSSTITYTYDGAHRLTDITDTLGNHIHYVLDAMGNHTTEDVYDPTNTLRRTHTRVFNTLNQLYTYVGNDPLDRTDPSGMCTLGLFGSDCQIWKSAAAAVASVQAAIAPIFGKGQTSVNTPTHASTSERIANEEAQKPDTKEVHLNRNLQKITGDKSMPNERPDITTVKKDDTISRTEVRSSGQTTQELQDKLSGSRGALGGRAGTDSVVEPDVVAPRVTLPEGTVPVRIPEVVIPEIFIP
jgi:YD repeat-containing protein